jgi:hypothetical protein
MAGCPSLRLARKCSFAGGHAAPNHSTNSIRPTEAVGAGIDRLPYGATDKLFVDSTIKQVLSSGWQTITYRQNTELHMEAWHWNPQGTWSDPAGKGYFTGSATPGAEPIRHSYGYPLPHRGVTRDDGTDTEGYSRITDGDADTYWKSNPYLSQKFTGESDSLPPQWVIVDLANHSHPLGGTVRNPLSGAVFHGGRSHQEAHVGNLADLSRRRDY